MAVGLSLAAANWSELTGNLTDRVFSSSNLMLIWLIYPVVKALHELGHAYAVKKWGGEVHEMGIMLIVLMPIPYVDASAASAFRSKLQRMVVGSMGMLVETFLAALAMTFWAFAEPGLARTIAYNVMLISGLSSLFFNGNPLLRFDAYYILADWIEIPNLGSRSNKYYGYLVQRYFFGMRNAVNPVSAPGEARWFLFYGFAAFVYRMFIMAAIILFVAGRFFFIGVILALWATLTQILIPIGKMANFVLTSNSVGRQRKRAVVISLGAVVALVVGLFVVPVPYATRADGVIWAPEHSIVRAAASGFVVELDVEPGTQVAAGQVLIRSNDPLLVSRVRVLEARLAEYQMRLDSVAYTEPRRTAIIREQVRAVEADLEDARKSRKDLTVVSPGNGTFVAPTGQDMLGRHVSQGDIIGYVLEADRVQVKVITDQDAIGKIRAKTNHVWVWPADRMTAAPIDATIVRDIPGGTQQLPNPVLGTSGGGSIPVDPSDRDGVATIDRVFELDIEFPDDDYIYVGRRVHVLFTHDDKPLAFQIARSIRQLFLNRFDV
jgi:putative peptide zinc metalloprotease protein